MDALMFVWVTESVLSAEPIRSSPRYEIDRGKSTRCLNTLPNNHHPTQRPVPHGPPSNLAPAPKHQREDAALTGKKAVGDAFFSKDSFHSVSWLARISPIYSSNTCFLHCFFSCFQCQACLLLEDTKIGDARSM